jgi:hypothetical protein
MGERGIGYTQSFRAEPIDPAGSLTACQVIDAWPEIGPTVLVHGVAGGWRQRWLSNPPSTARPKLNVQGCHALDVLLGKG